MPRVPSTRRRTGNPAGRVDTLAIRLLGRAVELHGDPIVRTIYGTFKPEIDHAIRGGLGGIKIHVPEVLQYPTGVQDQKRGQQGQQDQGTSKPAAVASPGRAKASTPRPKPTPDSGVVDMQVGADGVYEVSDAR
jgi:hypothetical protein